MAGVEDVDALDGISVLLPEVLNLAMDLLGGRVVDGLVRGLVAGAEDDAQLSPRPGQDAIDRHRFPIDVHRHPALTQKRVDDRRFAGIPTARHHQGDLGFAHAAEDSAGPPEQGLALSFDGRYGKMQVAQTAFGVRQPADMHIVAKGEMGVIVFRPGTGRPVRPMMIHGSGNRIPEVATGCLYRALCHRRCRVLRRSVRVGLVVTIDRTRPCAE